jgi:hypothetical protein|nr:MAG TPA: major capsid protein [Caudoviricetes sp.]
MAVLSKGSLFDPELVTDLINKVKGASSLAVLSKQTPIPFNGQKEFTFTLDKDIDVVAENGKKSEGGMSIEPVIIRPIKVEYGARVSDEFLYASEESKINTLKAFNEGFAKKVARGIDLMAFHGINPRTKQASEVIGTNHFDNLVTQKVSYVKGKEEENIEAAVAMIQGSNGSITGMAMSPTVSSELAKLKVNGVKQYPELAWGANPGSINGLQVDINTTVQEGIDNKDKAIIGDFANMFKWGYAKEIPMQVIEYGDPDNSEKDLKGYNQVYIRAEAYIGWGIMDKDSFAIIKED